MNIINLSTVSVDTTAGGTFILTAAQATDAVSKGMTCVVVNPDIDIVLVDNLGSAATVPGTAANSPWVCPAGVPTIIEHRSGPLKAITASGTATVKVSIGCAP